MGRMCDADRQHANLMAFPGVCITQIAILPRTFPTRDLPGRSRLTPALKQFVALFPAQHKPNVAFEHQMQPGSAGKLAIPNMADSLAPGFDTAREQLPQLCLLITGVL